MVFIQKDNFVIKCSRKDEYFIDSINFAEIYGKVSNFFNFNKKLLVKIYFIESINEFHFFNNKFEKWICGFTGPNNIIFIFSPSVIEKLTIHKKEEIPGIIIHELSHIIYGYSKLKDIRLINEGIASYLQSQYNDSKENEDINLQKINLFNLKLNPYRVGPRIINKIVQKFGKEKLLKFLRRLTNESPEEIMQKFKKEFRN